MLSLLCCVSWALGADLVAFGAGGMYVWPRDGVKIGKTDAVESSLVSEVTVESWTSVLVYHVLLKVVMDVPSYYRLHCPQMATCRYSLQPQSTSSTP